MGRVGEWALAECAHRHVPTGLDMKEAVGVMW